MHSKSIPLIWAVVLVFLSAGIACSNSSSGPLDPVTPSITADNDLSRDATINPRHTLLGLYTCIVNPDEPGIEMVPLRDSMFHLNALRFMEPPPPVKINLSNFQFDGQVIDVDIQLSHPFIGLDQYSGFDVCGILISSGSITGFSDSDIVVAGEGDVRLLNPDGLSRWWNPREFPYNEEFPMWGYIDGGLGTSDETANYSATLNGYKYHADGFSVWDELPSLDTTKRGVFRAGAANMRHYTIDIGTELVFNYAIDAAWLPPEGPQPYQVPDSFPESANREEPYFIDVNVIANTLTYDPSTGAGGGELQLGIDCYDWFHADLNTVRVESPGNFDPVISSIPTGGSDTYSTYIVDIVDPPLTSLDPIEIWVSAEAGMDYDGWLPGKPTSAFKPPFEVDVAVFVPQDPELVLVWYDETVLVHDGQVGNNDIEPALIVNGDGEVKLSWCWYTDAGAYVNYIRSATSYDFGFNFIDPMWGAWNSHSAPLTFDVTYNNKYTLGSNGLAFQSYNCPAGHALGATPFFEPHVETRSHSGTEMEHAGEMMYTTEGYPMMFGDEDGIIRMQRGDFPNQGGTGTWPVFNGTNYTLVEETGINNWLSIARSEDKTSDGRCHLLYWSESLPYIRTISSNDITGTDWSEPETVFEAAAELWVGASDPSLWIDEADGFHTLFAAEDWMGN